MSLVPGLDCLRLQMLRDGHFHALVHAIAALGLRGPWRAHRSRSLKFIA